ncbi:MAG: hypothetical protein K2J93_04970 [Anaeroplasmataceae bacterium]|nr:hypothetical protein [Anaeroplasmataceae bacterium]
MIILDVVPLPITQEPVFILTVLLGIFLLFLLALGIYLILRYIKKKGK